MKKNEDQLDILLAEILKEGALEEPENKLYTSTLMAAIYKYDHKKEKLRQFIYGVVGIIMGIIFIVSLILLWQNGLIAEWAIVAKNYIRNFPLDLPLKFTPVLLAGLLLHYLANGGFVIVYFLNRKRTKFS